MENAVKNKKTRSKKDDMKCCRSGVFDNTIFFGVKVRAELLLHIQ